MNTADNKQIALSWFKAFNTKKLDDLLRLYHFEARHYSPKLKVAQPETQGWIHGKDALRNWWEDAFKRLPQLHYEMKKITADNEQVFLEYVRSTPGQEDMLVGEVLEIENGLIVCSRVYHG